MTKLFLMQQYFLGGYTSKAIRLRKEIFIMLNCMSHSMCILIIPALYGKTSRGGETMIKQPSRDERKKSVSNDKATAKKEGINSQSGSNKSNNIFEALDAQKQ